jgi:hypothetical protein
VSEQITDKQDIVYPWSSTYACSPPGPSIRADNPLRVDGDKALLICEEGHA